MHLITTFLVKHFWLVHTGINIDKVKSSFVLSSILTPAVYLSDFILDWRTENKAFLIFVLGAIAIDHIIGTIIHAFYLRDFSLIKNIKGLLTKIFLVMAIGFLFEGMSYILKEESFIATYLGMLLNLTVFLYPAGSAFLNAAIMTNGVFPPVGLINKIRKFGENANLKEIIPEQKTDN
jgi:hypothetical protein